MAVNKKNLSILKSMVSPEDVAKYLKLDRDRYWEVFKIKDEVLYGILYRIIEGKVLTAQAEMALLNAQDTFHTKTGYCNKYFDLMNAHLDMPYRQLDKSIQKGGVPT